MNDYEGDKTWADDPEDSAKFDRLYRSIFGDRLVKIEVVTDAKRQKQGIDKILHVACRETGYPIQKVTVDEKKRRSDYPDIILEVYSDTDRQTPGWLFKPGAQYIAYAFTNSSVAYLLPLVLMRRWAVKNWSYLTGQCKRVSAKNDGYVTTSYAVPIDELLEGIKESMKGVWF